MNNKSEINHDIYKKNVDALQVRYKHIASRLLKNTPSPFPHLNINNHSLQNTSSDRKGFLQNLLHSNPFSAPFRNIIFIGISCFLKFKKQLDSAARGAFKIIVYEPNIDTFQTTVQTFDISKYIHEEHILFIIGSNNYFPGFKRLNPVCVHEKDLIYTAYNYCKSFFNYDWPLKVITENSTNSVFSFFSFLCQRPNWLKFNKKDYKRISISLFHNLFSQLKFARTFIKCNEYLEEQSGEKPTAILVFKTPRLWNWIELFKRGFSENGFNVEFVEIDKKGKYIEKALQLIKVSYPCLLITINRYAFDHYRYSIALEEILRENGIPYVSFVLDHLDYFFWEAEPRFLDNYSKYKLITYDRFFQENYSFGHKAFVLNAFFSYYINKKAQKNYQYDICISNRPREKYMHIFPEQEIIYKKILQTQAEPTTPVSSRLYIILWKLVNKIDEIHRPNINRHIVLNATKCFKMGFDSFFRRDVAQLLCQNYENVAVFGSNEWKNFIPIKNYKGMVTYKDMLKVYANSRVIVDSFISWSDTTVHDYISLSQGGFTIFHKPAICYNNVATESFEYFSTLEELDQKISFYLLNEDKRLQKLEEIQSAIDKFFSFDDYFRRATTLCNELLYCNTPSASESRRDDNKEFGTFVNKCNLNIFKTEDEQFLVNFMAAIIYFYSGYIDIAAECLNMAKQMQYSLDRELEIFERKINLHYLHRS